MYNNNMFNTQHILYIIISGVLTALLLWQGSKYATTEDSKNRILKFFAIITVVIHYSNLWVEYFTNGGSAAIENNHILPVYPCNVVMWMLLIASLIRNKQSLIFNLLGEFCFYCGTICGILGIVLNTNFNNNPTLADYSVLKGLLSHSTMLFGCLYMYFGRFIRIRVFNVVSLLAGLSVFILCGVSVNALYEAFGLEAPDGMWLRSNPYIGISPMLLGLAFVAVLFIILCIYDSKRPVEERWYQKLIRRH